MRDLYPCRRGNVHDSDQAPRACPTYNRRSGQSSGIVVSRTDRSLTNPTLSRILYNVDSEPSIWEQWQTLLNAESTDLLAILKLGAQLQAYFATVERETLRVARATGVTWAQLGEALGTSRQAVWQRATSFAGVSRKPTSGPLSRLDEKEYAKFRRTME
jgi:hypothetical protein